MDYPPPIIAAPADAMLELHDDTRPDSAAAPAPGYPQAAPHARGGPVDIDIEKTAPESPRVTVNTVASPIFKPTDAARPSAPAAEKTAPAAFRAETGNAAATFVSDSASEPQPTIEETAPEPQPYRIIGELFDTYILIEQAGQFVMIDKHAAHERYIYNGIKHLEQSADRQIFLTPQAVTLPRDDYFTIIEHPEALQTLGIVAEDFGEGTLLVRELPMLLDGFPVVELLGEVARALLSKKNSVTPQLLDELLYSVSCRAAVMAGRRSTLPEMAQIADMVLGEAQIRHCPHGRPVLITYTQREVEKLFGRIG